jgi:hypothetical protein
MGFEDDIGLAIRQAQARYDIHSVTGQIQRSRNARSAPTLFSLAAPWPPDSPSIAA